jgi:uncharacterized protein (DUF1501 family)
MDTHTKVTRRQFMIGCSAAIAALAGSQIRTLAFAVGAANPDALIVVFLRGGWDALNVVPPIADGSDRGFYETARPALKLGTSGANAALNLDGFFGMHPSLSPLMNLYQAQRLAVVHAAGLVYDTRSHFDAMQYIETATLGSRTGHGWLTRYLESLALPSDVVLPVLASGSSRPTSLLGYPRAVTMASPTSFNLGGSSTYRRQQTDAVRTMYGSATDWLDQAGKETIAAVDLIQANGIGAYTPANGALYPSGPFGNNLKLIAQMIKAGVGLTVATIDLGGWDTHENQGVAPTSYMGTLLGTLGRGLEAFHSDLEACGGSTDYNATTTVAVISEFGRRLKENANTGTDHGHGGVILLLGKPVKGGKVYGQWPGLSNDQLYQRADLAVTTDYRRVLSEWLRVRAGRSDPQLAAIFPDYAQQADLGLVHPPASTPGTSCVIPRRIYLPIIQQP